MPSQSPIGLRCERAENPIWIDVRHPRFSWRLNCERRGQAQGAYRILVARDAGGLRSAMADGPGALWDSGPVPGNKCLDIEYAGPGLESFQRYTWTVMIRDEAGNSSAYAAPAFFETALLAQTDWMGQWIGAADFSSAAAYFRRDFTVEQIPESCRLFVATPAWADVSVNGKPADSRTLDPAWTDWTKRLLYATYEIGRFLVQGRNTIGVTLGNGWYRAALFNTPHPSLPFSLFVIGRGPGGPSLLVRTEREGWQASAGGPIREHDLYNGETYDARLEMPGWDCPGFAAAPGLAPRAPGWQAVIPLEKPPGFLKAQALEPIRAVREIPPVKSWNLDARTRVFDFGVNFSGRLRIRFPGMRDAEVRLRHAETVDRAGRLQVENLRCALNTDRYLSKGAAREEYEPRFTWHGFRYAEIAADPAILAGLEAQGRHLRSDVREIGAFACSDETLNQIQAMVVRTESSNLHGLPTDCPQRDERLGWLNDMTVRAEEAVHNFGLDRLYEKWSDDIADTQGPITGAIADTAPAFRFGRTPADPVCASYLVAPWLAYLHYGDRRILAEHYAGFKAWAGCLESLAVEGCVDFSSYGDWAPPIGQARTGSIGAGALSEKTPGALMSTGFLYYTLALLAKIAASLGRQDEAGAYAKKAAAVRAAFNRKFLHPEKGSYATGSQACNVFPLWLGIVPEDSQASVLNSLVADLAAHEGRLTTGNLCTKFLPEALADGGRLDLALALLRQTAYPSWGYMLAQGATTVWERWEHVVSGPMCGMASHNHPMYGAVGAFFYTRLAGIRATEDGPGFEFVRIRPLVHPSLKHVRASLETPRGRLGVSWQLEDERFTLDLQIPWNAAASVDIPAAGPDRGQIVLESGREVWRAGQFIPGRAGVVRGERTDGAIRFRIGSGSYRFSSSPLA